MNSECQASPVNTRSYGSRDRRHLEVCAIVSAFGVLEKICKVSNWWAVIDWAAGPPSSCLRSQCDGKFLSYAPQK
jgi:hypothetical protein